MSAAALAVLLGLAAGAPAAAGVVDMSGGRVFCECSYHQGHWIDTTQGQTCESACFGSSGGGGAGAAASNGTSEAAAALGQAIGAGIVHAIQQSDAANAARREQLRQDGLRRQQELEDEAEARKDRLLHQMKGVEEAGGLSMMSDDPPVRDAFSAAAARALSHHNEEAAQRRAALARLAGKPEEAWCKLHLPQAVLFPTKPLDDAAGQYPGMLQKFARDRAQWDGRCGGPSAGGETALDKDLAALRRAAAPKPAAPAAQPSLQAAAPAAPQPRPAPAPAAAGLEAGGMQLMSDEPPAAPRAQPARAPAAPAAPEPAPAAPREDAAVPGDADAPPPVHFPAEPPLVPLTPFSQQARPAVAGDSPAAGAAPAFPASFGAEEVGAALKPTLPPVSQSAFDYIGAVVAVQKKRLTEATTESLKETGRSALSAEFSLGKILVNMLDLPEVVGEDLVKASSGELTPAEADLYVARSVNVLYNIGATPNKVLAKMIEKKDAFQGLVAYGADEVGDKAVALLEKGIPDLAAKKYAEWKYPRIKALKGTSADFVTMVLQQGTRITAKEDIVKNTVEMKEFLKTLPEFDEALKKAQEKAR